MGQGAALKLKRRSLMLAAGGFAAGCERQPELRGGFQGVAVERGHLLREGLPAPSKVQQHRTQVLIAGAGVSGLAVARALRQAGAEDFAVLEAEDQAGGNARSGSIAGIAHPLGAHYLPVPSDDAPQVKQLLEEMGLARHQQGRWVYDERALCHSPQERLFMGGRWQEGLLPLTDITPDTLAQYRRFARLVEGWRKRGAFRIPMRWDDKAFAAWRELSMPFVEWLGREGLADAHLLWYLNYCCRDDFGEGLSKVSAWAGIHYFASRHGFAAPGEKDAPRDQVLTWPEGNAHLTQYLAQALGDRLRTGMLVARIRETRSGVEVLAWDAVRKQWHQWQARACVLALPVHVARRVLESPPDWLIASAQSIGHSAWVVANVHINAPLRDRGSALDGAAPAWDNVIYASPSLGYVDARHQSTNPAPGPTVLTWYADRGSGAQARTDLLNASWAQLARLALVDIALAHPDIRQRATQVDITRYGHAMAVPSPQTLHRVIELQRRFDAGIVRTPRIAMAHSDWSGYSVFEEAFTRGLQAGRAMARV